MSQSPIDDFSEQATLSYKKGWRALNRLLHEDRSFSGHERNCAFLNTGGERARFSDISALTGFDFADDGRGLATADWDFDGDLDVWISNRTAPRVRLLQNNTAASSSFVAFKLEGDGVQSNRDAIGARVELHLAGVDAPLRIRTLHAGEGFLSQSSNWIHFGLGAAKEIERLIVRWPGGAPQEFTGIRPGQFYKLKQGREAVVRFNPPTGRLPLVASEQHPKPLRETARIIVPFGLPMPEIMVHTAAGSAPLRLSTERPTLLNLWSSTCGSCLSELTEWSSHAEQLAAAGVEVFTLSTDHLREEHDAARTKAALAKTGSTFLDRKISESSLQGLDDLQRAVLDRWIPLSLPATFLVSREGEVVAIYKGPVSTDQLLQDIALAAATPKVRRMAALPFTGTWIGEPSSADPKRVSSIMLDHNRLGDAIAYLTKCVTHYERQKVASSPDGKRNLGDLCYLAGVLSSNNPQLRDRSMAYLARARDLIPNDLRIRMELGRQFMRLENLAAALTEFTEAIRINPSDLSLRQDVGLIYFRLGNFPEAKRIFGLIVLADPGNGLAHYHLANTEVRLNNAPAAIIGYRKTLTAKPDLFDAANNLAWILASHPDENIRSRDEALALARRLCAKTNNQEPRFLDSLSVALANAGDFPGAIRAAEQAIAIHGAANAQTSIPIRSRIQLYQAGKPYRETSLQ